MRKCVVIFRGARALWFTLILLLFQPALCRTQDSLIIRLKISDARGHAQTMRFGVHKQATLGFDRELGEMPLPPYPPVPVFDVRFLHPDRRVLYAGDGSYADIRPQISPTQVDTFVVRLQAADNAYPMHISWDSSLLAGCDRVFVVDRSGAFRVFTDMKKTQYLSIEHPDLSTLLIVMRGPLQGNELRKTERPSRD
jgi:hypothetical protein